MSDLHSNIETETQTPSPAILASGDDEITWVLPYAFKTPGRNIKVNTAFLKFQSGLRSVIKDAANPFGGYTYASLDAIMSDILPRLTDCGLVLIQAIGPDSIITTITHAESGECFGEITPLIIEASRPKMSPAQLYGSSVTYARRYALGILGVTTSVDDDASGYAPEKITKSKPISAEIAKQLIADMIAIGSSAEDLNAAMAKSLGEGKTIYDLPEEKLATVRQWITAKAKNGKKKVEEVV